jgi:VWFA-related protein
MRPFSFLAVFLGPVLVAQNLPSPQGANPTFRANTNLVQLSVVVTDHGKHVSGLKREQFTVLEDGQPQTIAGFEELNTPDIAHAPVRMASPGVFSNAVSGERSARVTVVLLDLLNTTPAKQSHAREGFFRFLASLGETREPMMLLVLNGSGLHVVHDFTTDTAVLLAAVKQVRRQIDPKQIEAGRTGADLNDAIHSIDNTTLPGAAAEVALMRTLITQEEALELRQVHDRTQTTLDSLSHLAQALAGVPGHKALIWSTEGLAYLPTAGDAWMAGRRDAARAPASSMRLDDSEIKALNDRFRQTWQQLSSANVAVYPVDLSEVENPAFSDPNLRVSGDKPFNSTFLRGVGKAMVMNGFTDETGGRYCELQSHMENCFRAVVDDASRYYLVSYYASSRGKHGWRKTQVKVAAPGLSVRTRSGYFSGDPTEHKDERKHEIAETIVAPLDYTAIPLTFRWMPENNGGKRVFSILIHPSFSFDGDRQNHFRLTLLAAGRLPAGEPKGTLDLTLENTITPEALEKIQKTGILYRGQVEIPSGAESMRFVVRDEVSGRIGSVTARLPAP